MTEWATDIGIFLDDPSVCGLLLGSFCALAVGSRFLRLLGGPTRPHGQLATATATAWALLGAACCGFWDGWHGGARLVGPFGLPSGLYLGAFAPPLALGIPGGHGRGSAFGLQVRGLPAVFSSSGFVGGLWSGLDWVRRVSGNRHCDSWRARFGFLLLGVLRGVWLGAVVLVFWFWGLVFWAGSWVLDMTTGWMCVSTCGLFALCWCPFLGRGMEMPGPSLGVLFSLSSCQ